MTCWQCGTPLNIPQPVSRRETCPHCQANLHACRGCHFYQPASRRCQEPQAEKPGDDEAANFCDFFRPGAGGTTGENPEVAAAREKLAKLFGGAGKGDKR